MRQPTMAQLAELFLDKAFIGAAADEALSSEEREAKAFARKTLKDARQKAEAERAQRAAEAHVLDAKKAANFAKQKKGN